MPPSRAIDPPAPSDQTALGREVNVLLVDDRPENLLALRAVLEDLGGNLVTAHSGPEALRHLLRDDFAVILLDVNMPGMDGFETAHAIRSRERSRYTPIVFLSAIDKTETHVSRGYSLGAVDYLFKPFSAEVLRAKVSVFLQLARQTRRLQEEIRQREQAEAEIRLLNAELECRVRQRTQQLERADRNKDEWLAMLSHELRNPLSAMRTALEVLRLSEGPRRARAMETLERQVGHQVRLAEDLLDVSRIRRGKMEFHRSPVELTRLAWNCVEDHSSQMEQNGLKVTAQLPNEPLWVSGDATRLSQVVGNLLTNARKFTDAGGEVFVSLAVDASRREAVLSVRDTGVGIEAEMLPRIWESFAQVERNRARSGGLGLGLALVKGIAELHDGSVRAQSGGRGKGSHFEVRLPLSDTPTAPVDDAFPPGDQEVGLDILIVEDNPDSADTLRDLLELDGHRVRVASNGRIGVEMARQFHPDVVLSDLGLPELDGFGVARELRADPDTARTLLIAISGYGQAADRVRSREAGFDCHLVKPVEPATLRELLGRVDR